MPLTASQRRIAQIILDVGRSMGASPRERKAAIETGLVEANLSNPRGGHGTSAGWRQEIDTYGSVAKRRDVRGAARRFFSEARKANTRGGSAGQLAQRVQRSAYPARYDQRSGQAETILKSLGRGGGSARTASRGGSRTRARTQTIPGVDNSDQRRLAVSSFLTTPLHQRSLINLVSTLRDLPDIPEQTTTTTEKVRGSVGRSRGRGAPVGKTSKKRVHQAAFMAKKLGLHVGENPDFGGVGGGHVKGSYHYRNGRAIDVSGNPEAMRRFAHRVRRRFGTRISELFWQGSGGLNVKQGRRVPQGYVGGHRDHVHVAF